MSLAAKQLIVGKNCEGTAADSMQTRVVMVEVFAKDLQVHNLRFLLCKDNKFTLSLSKNNDTELFLFTAQYCQPPRLPSQTAVTKVTDKLVPPAWVGRE